MKATYNDILNNMKTAFFNECGKNADLTGDISARFEAVASEIYSLYCRLDYVKRQCFLQTAQGEYLDAFAQLRGTARKTDSVASGTLTFGVSEPAVDDIAVPAGTICSVSGKPFIQFVTVQDCTINAGATSTTVGAVAVAAGAGYNADAHTITVMVNVPPRVEYVTNESRFIGGYNAESDEALRRRLLDSFSLLPTGISRQYLHDLVVSVDGVVSCNFAQDSDMVWVYVLTNGTTLDQSVMQAVSSKLLAFENWGIDYIILPARHKLIDIVAICDADADEITKLCHDYMATARVGDPIDTNRMRSWIAQQIGTDDIAIIVQGALNGIIPCMNNERVEIRNVEVLYDR